MVEELKAEARSKGLWNLGLPDLRPDQPGTRLTNLKFAPLAAIMGRLPWAPVVFNCNAPNVPNMQILQKFGINGLYTNTLFRFKQEFFDLLGPAVELGRSFVRPEYQRQYAPLLLLWKAIGRYVALNPQHPVLFGAVSISNSYVPASRTLMYQFFKAQFATHPLAAMVQPRHPFRSGRLKHWDISAFNRLVRDPEELSGSISEFEFDGKGIPIFRAIVAVPFPWITLLAWCRFQRSLSLACRRGLEANR